MKSSSLLRNGEREGRVALRFEVDGKGYEVSRSLVKKARLLIKKTATSMDQMERPLSPLPS
jgi:DNA repair exonuclease SbcCD ATPase subunit